MLLKDGADIYPLGDRPGGWRFWVRLIRAVRRCQITCLARAAVRSYEGGSFDPLRRWPKI